MPTANTLTPRRKNLSATATLIDRLCHPLRIQRTWHSDFRSPRSPSAHKDEDERHTSVQVEWIKTPRHSGSPCQAVEIEDKGEYSEQRYGNVDRYWNSVMVEASEQEQAKRRLSEQERSRRQRRRGGRLFRDSLQLQRAAKKYRKMKDVNVSSLSTQSSGSHADSGVLPKPSLEELVDKTSNQLEHIYRNTNGATHGDRYITLTENASEAEPSTGDLHHDTESKLTWNSALLRILASPYLDAEVAATIRARARGRPLERNNRTHNPLIDMRVVGMVPNFSYPIASARWSERNGDDAGSTTNSYEHKESNSPNHQRTPEHYHTATNRSHSCTSITTPKRSPSTSSDSLYRAPTPPTTARQAPYSLLSDILDPDELDMYREIVKHDPRLTILLDGTDVRSRQICLVGKRATA